MTTQEFLEILKRAGKLKTALRHNWTEKDRKESAAEHSWRIALMAMLLSGESEYADYDMNKVIRMCLIHDLGEAFTGDIPAFLKNADDEEKEESVFLAWIHTFPAEQKEEWLSLLDEMKARNTPEANLYKALDKIEAVISHDEADISTWLPLEYDLQLDYAVEQCATSLYMDELRKTVDSWTEKKIAEEGGKPV